MTKIEAITNGARTSRIGERKVVVYSLPTVARVYAEGRRCTR